MNQAVGDRQNADRADDRQIAPVAPGQNFAERHRHQGGQKRAVDHRGGQHAKNGAVGHRRAPGKPQPEQGDQPPALQRHPPGPVGNGGQQKPGHHGGDDAERHFMGMPLNGRKYRAHRDVTGQNGNP